MKKFNLEATTNSYNLVPKRISVEQKALCTSCDYRIYQMQFALAKEEAERKGGSPRDYMQGFYIRPNPACDRKVCLIDKLKISRGKASASIPKASYLNQNKLISEEKRSQNAN